MFRFARVASFKAPPLTKCTEKVLDWIGCQWNENFWHVNKAWLKEKSLKVSLSQQKLEAAALMPQMQNQ